MMMDAQLLGPFSQAESSFMRSVYTLAEAGISATHLIDDQVRYTLASIVLYLSSCERQIRPLHLCNSEIMANEALDVLLSMPYNRMQTKL